MIVNCEQRSEEWFQLRLGKVTASRVAEILPLKSGRDSTARAHYLSELLGERLTGVKAEQWVSREMQWGVEQEPFARGLYEAITGIEVESAGFFIHPAIEASGASPDGLIGNDGLLEIKCPATGTHLEYIIADVVPEDYRPQMQWQMACSGRAWCEFVSYDPRLPDELQLFVARLQRDDVEIGKMEQRVEAFLGELEALMASWQKNKKLLKPAPQDTPQKGDSGTGAGPQMAVPEQTAPVSTTAENPPAAEKPKRGRKPREAVAQSAEHLATAEVAGSNPAPSPQPSDDRLPNQAELLAFGDDIKALKVEQATMRGMVLKIGGADKVSDMTVAQWKSTIKTLQQHASEEGGILGWWKSQSTK